MKLNNKLYLKEQYGQHCKKVLDNGYLFSGVYPTKIKPQDLPEYYIFGRYYKRWGYLSAQGITDLVYVPGHFTNHVLKDDYLLIAYGGKITVKDETACGIFDKYEGYDEYVCGGEIISTLRAAKEYSDYDIAPFIEAMKEKLKWCIETYPDDVCIEDWKKRDVDALFAETGFYRPKEDK